MIIDIKTDSSLMLTPACSEDEKLLAYILKVYRDGGSILVAPLKSKQNLLFRIARDTPIKFTLDRVASEEAVKVCNKKMSDYIEFIE